MKNKKGSSMLEDIGWTLIVLVVFEILAIITIVVYWQMSVPGSDAESISYSVEFVQVYNKPYMLAEVLAHTQLTDRQFLEQAIEISAAGSVEGASATSLPVGVKDFVQSYINSYTVRNYEISISRDNNEIITIDNKILKCGANSEGFCRSNIIFGSTCDVGYVEINDNGACGFTEACCKYDPTTYADTVGMQKNIAVVSCGPNQVGVCSQGRTPGSRSIPKRGGNICDYGEILVKDPVCNTANNGDTLLCCATDTVEPSVVAGLSTRSVVPLLYKNLVVGTLEVTIK